MRASYLLANGKALISERTERGEVPAIYENAVRWSPYEELAEHCTAVVNDSALRRRLEEAGATAMRSIPIAPLLEQAISRSGAGR